MKIYKYVDFWGIIVYNMHNRILRQKECEE